MAYANVLEMPEPKDKIHSTEHGRIRERLAGGFQIQFTDAQGQRHTRTLPTFKKAESELKAQAGLKAKGIVAEEDSDRRVKVSALGESYKLATARKKSAAWIALVWRAHLEPFFGHMNAGRVDHDMIERYRTARHEAGAADSTVNREVAILHAAFKHAMDIGKLNRLPRFPKKHPESNPRSGFLNPAQYAKLQAACKHAWLRALMAVAYNFGFRKSELLGLQVSQVDLKAHTIALRTGETKSGRGRTVVMTAEVLPLITACVANKQPGDSVFTWESGAAVKDFRSAWDNMCAAAGVEVLLHDFRRTAVRNLIRAGVSRDVARKISGHETDSIFSRYNITDETDLADAARKLESAAKLQQASQNVE